MNNNGFTYIGTLTIVVIMGIMLGMVGQSWKTIKDREREKEFLFRGMQIKEAIENWYKPNYTVGGTPKRQRVHPLLSLDDLLTNQYSLKPIRFLPHFYSVKIEDKNSKCGSDCPKNRLEEDPITGKKWLLITCGNPNPAQTKSTEIQSVPLSSPKQQLTAINSLCKGTSNAIVGVMSSSEEQPFKVDFKDSALESNPVQLAPNVIAGGTVTPFSMPPSDSKNAAPEKDSGNKISKYSEIRFEADEKNDHTKLYRAYRETW